MPGGVQGNQQADTIAQSGKITQQEIYLLALHTGMTPARAKVAAAIAMAESGGNPAAHNVVPPDDSYGLWQINMIGSLGPSRRKHFNLSSDAELLNPTVNAAAMYSISVHGGNFSPWSTYTNGSYRKYLNNPVSGSKADSQSAWDKFLHWDPTGVYGALRGAGGAVASTADALGTALEFVGKSAVWISDSKNWIRVAYVAGGSAVVLAGLIMVLRSSSAGAAAIRTAKRITP